MFEIELTSCIKMDLALNNLQRLICHKTQPTIKKNSETGIAWYGVVKKMVVLLEFEEAAIIMYAIHFSADQ